MNWLIKLLTWLRPKPAQPIPEEWIAGGGLIARISDSPYGLGISFNNEEACQAFCDFFRRTGSLPWHEPDFQHGIMLLVQQKTPFSTTEAFILDRTREVLGEALKETQRAYRSD